MRTLLLALTTALFGGGSAFSQATPTGYTFSTYAGGYSGTYSGAGQPCGGASSGSKYTTLDTLGNGCPLGQAILGPNLSGIGVDGAGNVYVNDYSNGQVRKIDAKSGIVTKLTGTSNSICSSSGGANGTVQDNLGDGCVFGSAKGPASARGMNVDPWGNVILGSYNSNMVNVLCLATSPLCPGTSNRKQVGSFYRVAGCIATQGGSAAASTGTAAYTGGDNSLASPFQNLSGDVAAWGLTGTAATAATVGATGNACGSTTGGVSSARNAQADKFGNVYIADTASGRYRVVLGPASYNSVTNPLWAVINMNPKYTANEGYIYTILGAFTSFTSNAVTYNVPTASGSACSSASSTVLSTDAYGDGCAFFETGKPAASGGSLAGLGVDKDGNPIFSDNADSLVRVLYVGGTAMANIISANNSGITPVVGTVYAIEGTGTASKGGTPQLDVSASSISSGNTKVAVDGQDNIYLSDGSGINIIDSATGYLRRPISSGGTLCAGGASNGDGCAAGQGTTWTSLSSVGTAITVDNLGNIYMADSTGRVRKLLAGGLYPTTVGGTFTQTLLLHEPAGTTGVTATLLNASSGITVGTPSCTQYTSTDSTADCKVPVTFAPTSAGIQGATVAVTNTGGGGATTLYPLTGTASGAALVTDVASPTTTTVASLGAGASPASLVMDGGGNLYTIDTASLTVKKIAANGTVTVVGTAPTGANQVAVDATGNVYVTAVGGSSVTEFVLASGGTYTTTTISNAAIAKPQGVVFDAQGNMYLSDATTQAVYQVPNNGGFANLSAATTVATGLSNPTLLAFDGSGNLLIADTGAVDRVNASTGALSAVASVSAGGVAISGLTPVGIAGDAGDNVYIQDAASKSVVEIPYQTFAPGSVTVLSGETAPSGVAVDGAGNVYVADSGLSTPAVLKVVRSGASYTFPTSTTVFNGSFTNAGNANATGYAQTDSAEFPYTGMASGGCGTISGTSSLLDGAACVFSVTPNLGNNGQIVSNTTTLLPSNATGSLVLTAQEPLGVTYTTSTTVTGSTTAVYSTGTELTFTVAETSTNNNSQNGENVNVMIDSGSPVAYTLANGQVSVPISSLAVGNHTITAVYPGDGTYLTSTGTAAFAITQAPTTVTWTPAITTQQFSAAVGTSVLNASADAPGSFVYTATPSGGSAQAIHSASYLPIGAYTLNVTFVPTDSVDYAQSTATVTNYTVTKASTTAAVGASQMVVAADGSGNYTTVQAAVNALPNGGSIYIKPGTYTGNITVVQPNVALRGLGGDPTKVVLQHAGGAFGSSYPYTGEFQVSMENGYQLPSGSSQFTGDEGSATLVVAKGVNSALSTSTKIPNGFYGENFTLANTYDTDTTTTTTTYETSANGTCTVNAGPARTYSDLYNNQILCGSQALAIWMTSDLAVMNNVYATSLQDTIYAASQGSGSNGYVPSRQYWFRGKVTGDVDYIFGDAAAVFDNTSIYTAWHGTSATGTDTIEAQNKAVQTGNSNDYLSGYVMNNDVFTSQSTGMSNLYFGRPYGNYSTWIMLNSYADQVNPLGYTTGLGPTLTYATYGEYNVQPYTDPATGSADLNGVLYLGTGGNSGAGVTGTREAASTNPGTPMAGNAVPTAMTQAQAQAYFPINFLSRTVPSTVSTTQNWDPTAALSANVNAFVPSGGSASVVSGTSVTLLMRPQTPGLGAIANGSYTIPTGTYTLYDTFGGNTTTLASGTLDASGEAYLTTSTLASGSHQLTWSYSGDSNFSGSTTSTPFILNVAAVGAATPKISVVSATNATYGQATSVTVSVAQTSGTTVPTGQVLLSVDGGAFTSGTLSSGGSYIFPLTGLGAGGHTLSVTYNGDSNFAPVSTSSGVLVAKAVLQVTANSFTIAFGQTVPTYTASITGLVNGDTQGGSVTGSPSLTTSPTTPSAVGIYPITASTGTLASNNYTFAFTSGQLVIQGAGQAQAVATGDTRTVTEPVFPAVCQTLLASITPVNDDIPTSVDATVTNPDGARIQAALNACAGTNQAVQLSVDNAGHSAFLTGPLNMPSGVTLLVDPGVVVFFSRNVQDYDLVSGTHTCGTVNSSSATSSCLPLINISNVSNVGIMGYGKLDGRGGDTLINAMAPYGGQSWWGLSSAANGVGNQQNPRFIQLSKATNVTLYKITLRNSPLFHVSTTGSGNSAFTAWDVKIITPTNARNTDGIDPGQAQNFTITRSWISDGDDNVAVGASGSASNASTNISVTNNHFFAGHGESIGSYTSAGVSNVLFDNNMSSGDGSIDSNSTGIRIKSANDRGGVVQNVQYSNSCYQGHKTMMEFNPLYNTNSGTLTPNFKNILIQNDTFLTAGTIAYTGANNNGTANPLVLTLDNVTFPTLSSSNFSPAPTNTSMTYGPGQVSSSFTSLFQSYVGSNGNTLADNRTAASLAPPSCNFTNIAPELTGPSGLPQTILQGQTATAVVILTPAIAGSPYPTGTVTLTDGASSTTTVTLTGLGDTVMLPLSGLSVGTHTFTATYSGDSNYVASGGNPYSTMGPYLITVNPGSLASTTTALSGVPTATTYGTSFTATATVAGNNPSGTLSFVVNGVVQATAAVGASGTAQATLNLPVGSYSISVVYSGDANNAGSTSSSSALTVGPAVTTIVLTSGSSSAALGVPVTLTATVNSAAGVPAGSVTFSYTTTTNNTPTTIASANLSNGVAVASAALPQGVNTVTASYPASTSFGASTSSGLAITVTLPTIIPLPNNPIVLPSTISTIAGGSGLSVPSSGTMACSGATDKYGDGCQGTAISFASGDDMRAVVADPFGNIYLSDISAKLVRKISPNGVITQFAGLISGTACLPTATVGCTPTQVSISKPRGIGSDAAGNIYIADYSLNKVFKVSASTGLMYLVAGTGTAGTAGDGGPGIAAQLYAPRGAWGDSVGNIYIADTSGNKIRVVDIDGYIHTFAGTGTSGSTGDGGPATSAQLSNPQGVITDQNLNVYISDSSSRKIRVVCVTCGTGSPLDNLLAAVGVSSPVNGDIYTIAGGSSTSPASYPALATSVNMSPQKLAFDTGGNLYISDSNAYVWMLDFHTGYIRQIANGTGSICSGATDAYGDGCPAMQAKFGSSSNGIGVGTDLLGNIYISETTDGLIRKVSTNLSSGASAVGTTTTQPINVHFIAGDSAATSNAFAAASSEWSLGTVSCTTNADTTVDCAMNSSFTPAGPGARSTPFTVTSAQGNVANLALSGTGLGAGANIDPASQSTFGANLQIAGLATDAAGNVYVADAASKKLLKYAATSIPQGAAAAATTLATVTAPSAVAVDSRGYAYVADSTTGAVTQVSPSGAVSTLATFTHPVGLTTDAMNNVYVADSTALAVYQVSGYTGVQRTLPVGALITPAGLAMDPSGNLLIADSGAQAVYRYSLQDGTRTALATPATAPSSLATDAAGNLFVADSGAIDAVPASSNSPAFTVATVTPTALAMDAIGNIYTSSGAAILKLNRTQAAIQFTASASPQVAELLNSGNQSLSITSIGQTDSTDFGLAVASSADCTLSNSTPTTLNAGGVCTATASYTPTVYTPTTDTVTLNANETNATPVDLVLSSPSTAPAATIVLGASSPSAPVYGQTVTLSATVTGTSLTPTGSVTFTVDSATQSANLVNGTATVTFSGLSVGSHTVSAAYSSTNGYAAATTGSSTLTIAKASQTITFSAIASPVSYGAAPIALSATGGASGNPVVFSIVSGPATVSGSTLTVTGAGTIQVAANQVGNANYNAAAQVTQSVVANKVTPGIALTSSANPAPVQSAVTFTATMSSTVGAPTGTVTFLDGTTPLGTGTLTSGVAALTTSSLSVGSHSITAAYGGDPNFNTMTSTVLTENIADLVFSIPSGDSASATVLPGGTAVFVFTLSPGGGSTFSTAVSLSLSGFPTGATYTFSPSTIPAGAGPTQVTLTIQLPKLAGRNTAPLQIRGNGASRGIELASKSQPGHGRIWPAAIIGALLLPLLGARSRRLWSGKALLGVAFVAAAFSAVLALNGCGGSGGASMQPPQTYTLTVTGTAGSLVRTTTLTLTVQ